MQNKYTHRSLTEAYKTIKESVLNKKDYSVLASAMVILGDMIEDYWINTEEGEEDRSFNPDSLEVVETCLDEILGANDINLEHLEINVNNEVQVFKDTINVLNRMFKAARIPSSIDSDIIPDVISILGELIRNTLGDRSYKAPGNNLTPNDSSSYKAKDMKDIINSFKKAGLAGYIKTVEAGYDKPIGNHFLSIITPDNTVQYFAKYNESSGIGEIYSEVKGNIAKLKSFTPGQVHKNIANQL